MSYAYNKDNIADTLIRAMEQGASYDEVDYLLKQRNRKIESGGDALAQYKNDDLTKDAEAYLERKITKPKLDLDAFRSAREEVAAENLRQADKRSTHAYQSGVRDVEKNARKQREALYADYRGDSLVGDEALAAIGLGKSHGKPSSGYGETAKTALYLGYQDALGKVRDAENQQKADLYDAYVDRRAEDRQNYAQTRDVIAKETAQQSIDQFNADREFRLDESEHNAENNRWNQEFDYTQMKDAVERTDAREKDSLDRAHEAEQSKLDREHKASESKLEREHETSENKLDREHETSESKLEREHETSENKLERAQETGENELDRKHDKEMFDLESAERKESEARTEKQKQFEQALESFKITGIISTQAMADILGLPVGTKTLAREEFENQSTYMWSEYNRDLAWHEEEMRAKEAAAANKAASSGSKGKDFDDYYDLFKAVGEVITQEMADALGLPLGTKYWQYVESQRESDRKDKETDFETGEW